ncbi:hypothetical protein CERZMDRAFT_85075 [Cercospora zeae-maydis SCOH1-5]|uniref:Uncharacterized protein n=1 Tax=Cercospora zeae-maydis SCOH1-5 TaxID=717836 RepID=A0A6A6FE31_9PEZI|nr:hypothetical protein CERZMDRAFT_85075 [Cercospora zeae-maydis SCOH1-5]
MSQADRKEFSEGLLLLRTGSSEAASRLGCLVDGHANELDNIGQEWVCLCLCLRITLGDLVDGHSHELDNIGQEWFCLCLCLRITLGDLVDGHSHELDNIGQEWFCLCLRITLGDLVDGHANELDNIGQEWVCLCLRITLGSLVDGHSHELDNIGQERLCLCLSLGVTLGHVLVHDLSHELLKSSEDGIGICLALHRDLVVSRSSPAEVETLPSGTNVWQGEREEVDRVRLCLTLFRDVWRKVEFRPFLGTPWNAGHDLSVVRRASSLVESEEAPVAKIVW